MPKPFFVRYAELLDINAAARAMGLRHAALFAALFYDWATVLDNEFFRRARLVEPGARAFTARNHYDPNVSTLPVDDRDRFVREVGPIPDLAGELLHRASLTLSYLERAFPDGAPGEQIDGPALNSLRTIFRASYRDLMKTGEAATGRTLRTREKATAK